MFKRRRGHRDAAALGPSGQPQGASAAGVRKKPPCPAIAPWAGQGAHRGSPARPKHRQVPRCHLSSAGHSCAPVPGRGEGHPAPLALPLLCLSVTQQPAEERRGAGERRWLCFHSLNEPRDQQGRGCQTFPSAGDRDQAAPPALPTGGHKPERSWKEGQADACTILALGWGLCRSNCFLPLLPTPGRP